jgi:hypothetical protein
MEGNPVELRVMDLRFWRDGELTRHDVLAIEGELEVKQLETALRSKWE